MATNLFTGAAIAATVGNPVGWAIVGGVGVVAATVIISQAIKKTKPIQKPHG